MKKWLYLPVILLYLSAVSVCGQETGEVVALPNDEYIKEWTVLGPFFPSDLDRDFLAEIGGEANVDPREGDTVTTSDGALIWKHHSSQEDVIDLQDAMKQLLFSIDLQFQSELDDSKQPSEDLRQTFEDSGFILSRKTRIAINDEGSRWWVIDKDNQRDYVVLKEDEKLNIYSEPRDAVGYVACNILSQKNQCLEMVLARYYGVKVWVNGSLIHSTPEPNRWDTERFGIPLRKGANLCVIKVGQYIGGTEVQWGFNARVLDYDTYLNSLKLGLTVRCHHPDGKDELTISARREPRSAVWELPAIPINIEIRDEARQLLETWQSSEGKPFVWTVPEEVKGKIGILAKGTDPSREILEDKFAVQAHNIVPVTPQVGHWETYDVSNGLGGSQVFSIMQAKDGFLWFGLRDAGIRRYDGRTFHTFTKEDGLPSNDVYTLLEDSKGNLWIGTMNYFTRKGAGVCRYDGETFQSFKTEDGLASDAVIAIYEDNQGYLWFGTEDGGVSKFDGKTFRNYTKANGLPSNRVGAITQDMDGNFWFGHGLKGYGGGWVGATQYNGDTFRIFTKEKDGLADNSVMSIITDVQGNIWFGTVGGASKYDGKSFQKFTIAEGLANDVVHNLFQSRNGDIWFGTWGGVSKYDGKSFQRFTARHGLAHDWVLCITADREGSLWFGTMNNGVSRYDESIQNIPAEVQGLHSIRDSSGNIWFAVPDGVCKYDGEKLHTFRLGFVFGICEDSQGNIWVGTGGGGLTRYDGKEFQWFTTKDGLSDNTVRSICESRTGLLWIGTWGGGICIYDGERFVQVAGKKELGEGWDLISRIIEDSAGNMLFGMPIYGIGKYDGEKFVKFSPADGLSGRGIFGITEDREGNIWFPSGDGGASRYDGENFQVFTTAEGFTDNELFSVYEDNKGDFWFGGGTGGVYKYDERNFQVFTTADGLPSNYSWKTLEDEAGNMIFLTSRGIVTYTLPDEQIAPPVFVREIVADKIYRDPKELTIFSTVPRVSFSYYGASFKTKRMRYNYMLEGYDTDWQATWDEEVSYEDLQQGTYTFRVIAIDRDLNYSEPASVELQVIPDPRNYRIAQLEVELEERERARKEAERIQAAKMESLGHLVAGVAHQINNPVAIISSNNDLSSRVIGKIKERMAECDPQEIKEDRQLTSAFARLEKMNEGNQIASGGIAEIVANLRSFVRLDGAEWQIADIHKEMDNVLALMEPEFSGQIRITRDYGDIPGIYCSPRSLNQVFMSMFRNACEAIEGAGEMRLRTFIQEEQVIVAISDTGVGIPSEDIDKIFDPGYTTKGARVGAGLGLSICYQIVVDEHKGRIDVLSEPGKGTTFTITLPQYHDGKGRTQQAEDV